MNFFSKIPRGLLVFLGALIVVILLVMGYRALFTGNASTGSNSSGSNLFRALFPFGNPSQPSATPSAGTGSALATAPAQTGAVPILRHVSPDPVSGAWFVPGPASTSPPSIRYMERQSGHIEETPADSFAQARISNTTVPGIQELYAVSSSTLLVRSLGDTEEIQNYFGAVNAAATEQSFTAIPLRRFDRVALVPGGNIFTVTQANGSSRTELSKADGSKLQTLFASAISSWVPLAGGSRLFLETAPTAAAEGYLYELKKQGNASALAKIAGGARGFTALPSPSGRYVAYSGNGANGFEFSVLDTKTGSVWASPMHALALKCAWIGNAEPLIFCAIPLAPSPASYPDDWLIGNVSFSDDAWIIDPAKNTDYFIGSLADDAGVAIDAENISVDASGSYALLMNKKDLSLWSLNIANAVLRALGK